MILPSPNPSTATPTDTGIPDGMPIETVASLDEQYRPSRFQERLLRLNTGAGCLIEEYGFLEGLAGLLRPRAILEVGASFGVGALALLSGACRFNHDATVTTIDVVAHPQFDANLALFPEYAGRIERVIAPSHVALSRLADEGRRFDLVFIDASHDYDDVTRDFALCRVLSDFWILHDTAQMEGCRRLARELAQDPELEVLSLNYPKGRQVFHDCVAEGRLFDGLYHQDQLPWTTSLTGPGATLVRQKPRPAMPSIESATREEAARVLGELRSKWHEVPAGHVRRSSRDLMRLPAAELASLWRQTRDDATTGEMFSVRGWYHALYRDILRGKKVLDVGSGLGIDGISFALEGARVTFLDIVEENLDVLRRICSEVGVGDVSFLYLETLDSLDALPNDFDVIWAQGSLINAPLPIIRTEAQLLLGKLKPDGRWIELAYPRERWEREGALPFAEWGSRTDGGAPWIEWRDLGKTLAILAPSEFDVVLSMNFHNNDFNWFDLRRRPTRSGPA